MDITRLVEDGRLSFAYTQAEVASIARSDSVWMLNALALNNAAKALRERVNAGQKDLVVARLTGTKEDSSLAPARSLVGPMLMLYGITFEVMLKARHIALNPDFDPVAERGKWWTGHNLKDLASKTGWSLGRYTSEELIVIEELSTAIQLGRYPFHMRDGRSGSVWGMTEAERVDKVMDSVVREVFSLVLTKLEVEGMAQDAAEDVKRAGLA